MQQSVELKAVLCKQGGSQWSHTSHCSCLPHLFSITTTGSMHQWPPPTQGLFMQAHYRFLRKGQWSSCRRTWPCWRECRRPAFPPDWGSRSAAPGSNRGRTQRRTGCRSQLPLRWLKEHSDIMCIMPPTVTITTAETVTSCALRHLQSPQWLKQWHHMHYATYSHHYNGWKNTVTSCALLHLEPSLQWLKTVTSCALPHLQSLLQWLKHSEYVH